MEKPLVISAPAAFLQRWQRSVIGAYGNDGNGDHSGHVRVFSLDNTPPTIAVSSDVSSLKAGETATLTFTRNHQPTSRWRYLRLRWHRLQLLRVRSSYSATFTPTKTAPPMASSLSLVRNLPFRWQQQRRWRQQQLHPLRRHRQTKHCRQL